MQHKRPEKLDIRGRRHMEAKFGKHDYGQGLEEGMKGELGWDSVKHASTVDSMKRGAGVLGSGLSPEERAVMENGIDEHQVRIMQMIEEGHKPEELREEFHELRRQLSEMHGRKESEPDRWAAEKGERRAISTKIIGIQRALQAKGHDVR